MRKLFAAATIAISSFASQANAGSSCLTLFTQNNGWWVHNNCGSTVTIHPVAADYDGGLVNAPANQDSILGISATRHITSLSMCYGFGCNPN